MSEILVKFLRFFARKVSAKPCSFNVKKGVIRTDKPSRLFISVKDPFIKYINHGKNLKDRKNYRALIEEMSNLLEMASNGETFSYIYSE